MEKRRTAEEVLATYFEKEVDMNKTKPIEILPLTIIDAMLEYAAERGWKYPQMSEPDLNNIET